MYADNIAVSGGTFSITIARSGVDALQILARAIEYAGSGTANPLVGSETGIGNSSSPSCATGTTGSPEVAVIAALSAFRLNFDITNITVGAQTPAFLEEYEQLASSFGVLAGEGDARIDNTGTASGAQSVSWTMNVGINWAAAIIPLYSTRPSAFIRLTEFSREVLEQDGTVAIRMTQFAREILYLCLPKSRTDCSD